MLFDIIEREKKKGETGAVSNQGITKRADNLNKVVYGANRFFGEGGHDNVWGGLSTGTGSHRTIRSSIAIYMPQTLKFNLQADYGAEEIGLGLGLFSKLKAVLIDKPKKEKEPEVEEVVEEVKEEEPEVEEVVEEVKEEEPEVVDDDKEAESLKKGLEKTKKSFFSKIKSEIIGKSKIDDQVLDDLEEVLITSDVGVKTTIKIIERIEERVSKEKYTSVNELNKLLKDEIVQLLAENSSDLEAFDVSEDQVPYVILIVGVNGVGKTTTIGKLAAQFKEGGLKVLLGAADTFRAAAVDQLLLWAEKVGVDVVSHGMNTDPASVAYDTVKKAVNENYDVVIIDTAGRLHTKVNLMNELSKIKRVIQKFKDDAPHEIMLILDGSTGQNAFVQAEEFIKVTDVNSIAITKLDGTAKGGVVIGITDQFKIPIKYIGVGEKIGDLQLFHKGEFVNSFFD